MERSIKIFVIVGSLLAVIVVGAIILAPKSAEKNTANDAAFGENDAPAVKPIKNRERSSTENDVTPGAKNPVFKPKREPTFYKLKQTKPMADTKVLNDERDDDDIGEQPNPTEPDADEQLKLGPKSWMGEVPEDEQAKIDDAFARAAIPDPMLTKADRRTSIDIARGFIDSCLSSLRTTQPDATGRVIVSWNATATGGVGRISSGSVDVNLGLREPSFEACIVSGLDGQTFQAERDGELRRVRYPFFFDEE